MQSKPILMKNPLPVFDELADVAVEPAAYRGVERGTLESHLAILEEEIGELRNLGAARASIAEVELQIARTFVGLNRGKEAWSVARPAFDIFLAEANWESAVDACEVLFLTDQPQSLAALGQGIWLAVTYPIDPELSVELLSHVVEETPDDSDGAAVAAATALFLADIRSEGPQRDNLIFFTRQMLGEVAQRHSGADSQAAFDLWLERLELREPEKFLGRLRQIVDALVQDDWWFDRHDLQARLPLN